MSDDELYVDRYDKEDLRQILALQTDEYRHLQTQALRLIRIVIAIIAVVVATASLQFLFQVFPENPIRFSLALNSTAAERLLLGSEQQNISMSNVEARRPGIGPVNQTLGIHLGLLSVILLAEAILYSFIAIRSDPPEPLTGVADENDAPKASKDRLGNWVNRNTQTLDRLSETVTLSYMRLGLATLSAAAALTVIISLHYKFIIHLIIIDVSVVITVLVIVFLLLTRRKRFSNYKDLFRNYLKILGIPTAAYGILIGPLIPQILNAVWTVIRLLPYLK